MELLAVPLTGAPARWLSDPGSAPGDAGVVGVDIAAKEVDGQPRTVVQLLFDDDRPGFDRSLLDSPLVAEVVDDARRPVVREPFDHDLFRRRLHGERLAGESTTRGVLVLTGGQLPPAWVRLAFLPIELTATDGMGLAVRRTTVAELRDGVEQAHAAGTIGDAEREALLVSIEQLHPEPPSPG